jgi:signal transduction histidine kinase
MMYFISFVRNKTDEVYNILIRFLMLADKKIFPDDMKVVKISDYPVNRLKGSGVQLITTGNRLSEVIENADGVPFQLIFGREPGEGYYVNVGAGFRQLLGTESADLTEKLFLDMIEEVIPLSDNIPVNIRDSREKFLRGEIEKYKVELLIKTPSGEKKWIRDSSLPLRDDATGRIIGSVGILFNITDTKTVIESLALANERAVESELLKTAFLRNISHEVRTPLNAIVGFSSLICEPEYDGYIRKEYRDIINNSADHLLNMMNNIFEISQLDTNGVKASIKEVNLSGLLLVVQERFAGEAESKKLGLRLELPFEGYNLTILTDEMKLLQIISNIVSNAIKFTESGSIAIGYKVNENTVEIFVSDTGIGIPEEHKPHIFKRFYQAESGPARTYPGAGLGLAISKGYTDLLGGSIGFTSELGRGSEFRVIVPAGL